jgi:adenosylcobyric acid synthase
MLQGTGSDVGKSVLTAALCRIARRRGLSVAPFKPQNMSNNAAACPDGGEIGRAQALQAQAAGIPPRTDFNPVLLKPQSDQHAQVVVHGKAQETAAASDYFRDRGALLEPVLESFERLTAEFDLVIVEGAGSPAEINLRDGDIANMGFALAAGVPVVLIGDIEKGGVIASLVGTQTVLEPEDAAMISGFIVNKFRGDPRLFDNGVAAIEQRTGWPCYGVIPWLPAAARLPAEDAVPANSPTPGVRARLVIAAPMLSRMANFDDADPLRQDPAVDFRWVPPGQSLPRDTDVVILFGTKSTLGDLAFLRAQGWDHDLIAHVRSGGRVLGLCGGYQMLGQHIADPEGLDGNPGSAAGLGLLDVSTTMRSGKAVRSTAGHCALTGCPATGYEIHTGETVGPDCARPMLHLENRGEGATGREGKVEGCYLHGLFASDGYRAQWLTRMGADVAQRWSYAEAVEAALDQLASHVQQNIDVESLLATAKRPVRRRLTQSDTPNS